MPFMQWTSALDLGIAPFDDQHKKLVVLLNSLYDAMRAGQGKDALGKILDGLVSYTRTHFADEERYLALQGYPGLEGHKLEHDALTRQVLDVQKRYKTGGGGTLTLDVLDFLKRWLAEHIQGSDKRYGAFVAGKPR